MWKRSSAPKPESTLDDVNEWLEGFGRMVQRIDAKLEEIVELLRQEEDDE